ncbi:MAG: flagellar brake protein [Firmicutes bacterium]|nr:flagellar brake protein [Bacillota bacterium]
MIISPNQLIELKTAAKQPKVYKTRVEDAYDDQLIVGAPLEKGNLVPLRVGTKLSVEFKLKSAVKEGRFKNQAVIEKRFRTTIPLLQLRLLEEWEKIQEREFVRVPVVIDAFFNPIVADQKQEDVVGVILNLSGGGFLLRTTHSFALQDKIEISFKVDTKWITALAEVMRLIISCEAQDYGFRFLELEENARQNIIQYVFKRQLEIAEKTPGVRESAESYAGGE